MHALNPAQRAAVRSLERPLLVLAGAGSGKTRVITEKIAHLIEHAGLSPREIAALTFTNKAAREMRERVTERLAGRDLAGLRISTFHTLGLTIVKEERDALGYRTGFSIYDPYDVCQLLGELLCCDPSDPRVTSAQHYISSRKNGAASPSASADDAALRSLFEEYERQMHTRNAVDLDDLIALPVRLLRENDVARRRWQERLRYLLVDEYQDTNGSQYELVKLLVGPRVQFTVVGDDDQSIYAWRGARPQNLQQLARDFPALQIIKLEQNYRSTRRILKAANQLISRNRHLFEKRLWSDLGMGDPIRVLRTLNENDEAAQVVAQLLHHRLMHRCDYRDYAILYRGNHQSRPFEQALRERGIPYSVSGAMSFFEYGEVRDVLAYLRLLANPTDDGALLRIINTPRREIGPTTVEKLSAFARAERRSVFDALWDVDFLAQLSERIAARVRNFAALLSCFSDRSEREPVVPLLKEFLEAIGYRAWLEGQADNAAEAERRNANVDELVAWIARLVGSGGEEKSLPEVLNQISLMVALTDRDADESADRVHLMTLHAAKGLEFPHVFLVGMEEELLPHRTSIESGDIEEERRLAYVGITRARRTLTLSWAASRRRYGETRDNQISRFVSELPAEDLEWLGEAPTSTVSIAEGRHVLAALKNLVG